MMLLGVISFLLGATLSLGANRWADPYLTEEARRQVKWWGGGVYLLTNSYVPEAPQVVVGVILANVGALVLYFAGLFLVLQSR